MGKFQSTIRGFIREKSWGEFLKKLVIMTFANAFMALGSAFIFVAEMGNDPVGILFKGVWLQVQDIMSYGTVNVVVSAIIVVFLVFVMPKTIYWGTIIATFTYGIFMDMFLPIIYSVWPNGIPEVARWILPIVGVVIVATGVAIYLPLNWGVSSVDGIVLWFQKVLKLSYTFAFWGSYAVYTLIGWLLGAELGFGTIFAVVASGPIINFLVPKITAFYAKRLDIKEEENPESELLETVTASVETLAEELAEVIVEDDTQK